ncbi:MAG: hypothetical protein GX331_11000 [Firmicutes bacterium]|jgi:phosphate/sulfate permease|nr:hypothetical protein [Bacillota bacterium]
MNSVSVYETTTYLAFIMPIILFALSVILTLCLRWFTYREKMAMIERGIPPHADAAGEAEKNKKRLAYGVTTALIGVALTLGFLTIGIGPWLLVGLIPLFVGLSIILSYLILQPPKPKKQASQQPALEEPDSEEIETDMDESLHDDNEYEDDQEKRAL